MKIPLRQPCRRMIILTIIVGMLIGCTSVFQNLDDRMHRNRFKLDYEAFEKALRSIRREIAKEHTPSSRRFQQSVPVKKLPERRGWEKSVAA
jgi:hypothetical protein